MWMTANGLVPRHPNEWMRVFITREVRIEDQRSRIGFRLVEEGYWVWCRGPSMVYDARNCF